MLNEEEYSRFIEGCKELSNAKTSVGETIYMLPIHRFREFLQQFRQINAELPDVGEEPPLLAQIGELFIHIETIKKQLEHVQYSHKTYKQQVSKTVESLTERIDKLFKEVNQYNTLANHHSDQLQKLEKCLFYLKGLHPELGMRDQDQAIMDKLIEKTQVRCRCPKNLCKCGAHGYRTTQKPQRENFTPIGDED